MIPYFLEAPSPQKQVSPGNLDANNSKNQNNDEVNVQAGEGGDQYTE